MELQGAHVLITGASRGIGAAMAREFAIAGATVSLAARSVEGLSKVAAATGGLTFPVDLLDEDATDTLVARVEAEAGPVDVLVNNAGINTLKHRVTIEEFPREEWDRIIAVDLTAAYEMSRMAAKIMKGQRKGRILNISSIAGVVPLRLQCAFTAAKAGLNNLTRAMAIELGKDGILVNAIAPGSIMTDGTRKLFYGSDGLFHENVQRMIDHIPLGRPGTTEEIAQAALFLAAPENTYLTGHILVVDGGWTAGYHRDF